MPRMPQVTTPELVGFLTSHVFVEDRHAGTPLPRWHEGRQLAIISPIT